MVAANIVFGQKSSPCSVPSAILPLIDFASYSSIPRVFVNVESHPSQTNLLCWHCSLSFSGPPRFIAHTSSHSKEGQLEWDIEGNFCSWACAAAYIGEHFDEPKKWSLMFNLATVRAQVGNCAIRDVARAPSKITMSSYIGAAGMSQQAFAALVAEMSKIPHSPS